MSPFEVGDRVTLSPALRLQATGTANGSVFPGEFTEQRHRRGNVTAVRTGGDGVTVLVTVQWDATKLQAVCHATYPAWKLVHVSIVDRIAELDGQP